MRWIAFLRAINVGGHTVKMDRLRSLFEALGFNEVQTFIASGNVIFSSEQTNAQTLEAMIEQHLEGALGYAVPTFLRTPSELAVVAAYQPFGTAQADGSTLYIGFLSTPPSADATQKLLACRTEIDDFAVHDREVYWVCQTQFHQSTFSGARLEKTLGLPATLRNATTVRKLAAKYAQS